MTDKKRFNNFLVFVFKDVFGISANIGTGREPQCLLNLFGPFFVSQRAPMDPFPILDPPFRRNLCNYCAHYTPTHDTFWSYADNYEKPPLVD